MILGGWRTEISLTNLCQPGHFKNVVYVKVFLENKELVIINVIKFEILPYQRLNIAVLISYMAWPAKRRSSMTVTNMLLSVLRTCMWVDLVCAHIYRPPDPLTQRLFFRSQSRTRCADRTQHVIKQLGVNEIPMHP